jgi:triosephosphate isomerase (TIM)
LWKIVLNRVFMRNYIIAGNWKMNGSKVIVNELLNALKSGVAQLNNQALTWVVFPPYPFLSQVEQILTATPVKWGAQNVCDKPNGAYTGEVSLTMLQEFGCRYVLIGHSERRNFYGETDEIVVNKFKAVVQAKLIPILCVGETLIERQHKKTYTVLQRQLAAILNLDDAMNMLDNAIIAYEPVWAIGTGMTAAPEQAQEVHKNLRNMIAQYNISIAKKMPILYGGSLKPDNAKALFAMPDIDGGLIGGASLKAEDFLKIGATCNS